MTASKRLRIVPMILVMGTIFFLSHQPGDSLELPGIPGLDKAAHFLIYALLAAAVIFSHSRSARMGQPLKTALVATAVCFLYGLTDEFHQSFIPGRFMSGADLVADVLGGAFAGLLWLKMLRSGRGEA